MKIILIAIKEMTNGCNLSRHASQDVDAIAKSVKIKTLMFHSCRIMGTLYRIMSLGLNVELSSIFQAQEVRM